MAPQIVEHLVFVNKSTLMDDHSFGRAVEAVRTQLQQDVAHAWAMFQPTVHGIPAKEAGGYTPPAGSILLAVVDAASDPQALGWHTEDIGPDGTIRQYGEIACKPVLDNGGDLIHAQLSVSSVMSHEAVEAVIDPTIERYTFDPNHKRFVAWEACDPVESDSYVHGNVAGGVTVSNFVTPCYFDAQDSRGPFDFLDRLAAPLSMNAGGYLVVVDAGKESQVFARKLFGHEYPEWRKATKERPWARTARRQHQ